MEINVFLNVNNLSENLVTVTFDFYYIILNTLWTYVFLVTSSSLKKDETILLLSSSFLTLLNRELREDSESSYETF